MSASGRRMNAAHLVLRAVLAALLLTVGLSCAGVPLSPDAGPRTAAEAVDNDSTTVPRHESGATVGIADGSETPNGATAGKRGCGKKHAVNAEVPAPPRAQQEAPLHVLVTAVADAPFSSSRPSADSIPGRGGPAPPSPPSLEALSVLRV